MSELVYNFSHSLHTKMDCMLKTGYTIVAKDMGLQPIYSPFVARGVALHKNCEQLLKQERLAFEDPAFEVFFRQKVEPLVKRFKQGNIVAIEKEISSPLTDTRQGKGIIDLVYGESLYDWKFTLKPWTDAKLGAYKKTQGLFYLWLANQEFSWTPKRLVYWIFPLEGAFQSFEISYNEKEVQNALDLYRRQCSRIDASIAKDYWEPEPGTACRWCDFNDVCPEAFKAPRRKPFGPDRD